MSYQSNYSVDVFTWYAEREVSHAPCHFVVTNTPVTNESKKWVLDNLKGRFSILTSYHFLQFEDNLGLIAFEDPEEATFYELKWS